MWMPLNRQWNGGVAPSGLGGSVELALEKNALLWEWNLTWNWPSRVPEAPACRLEGLWEWDVLELFLAPASPEAATTTKAAYLEIEVSPGGHWLDLGLAGVRQRLEPWPGLELQTEHRKGDDSWQGKALLHRKALVYWIGEPPWKGLLALCAGPPAERVYLCEPPLPGPQADFHQPDRWRLLDLEP